MPERRRTEIIFALELAEQLTKATVTGLGLKDECNQKYREIEDVNHNTSDFSPWIAKVSKGYKDAGYFFAHSMYWIRRTLREAKNPNVSTAHLENCMMKIHKNLMQVNKTTAGGNKQLIRDDWSMYSRAMNVDPFIFADASTNPSMIKEGGGHGIKNDI